ncbi:cyclin-dependent protein kinase [Serendipita sp. 411]|nr:cyclin-dependent protein kinase [Serendipita sp. 400]KAG8828468.1 cyclin-dependent protein kinase [Serendipita sp. 401]KAG8860477.1 cyclin-dependent protein kinase [Serendipita sp. 411]KAG9058112.1 cyclin-dependent protein kinase [Serendipita sp. 407]
MASSPISHADQMATWRARKDARRATVQSKYTILGFISSGTYGRVYKARERDASGRDGQFEVSGESKLYAIKKFKPEKEGEVLTYTGISQSAIREIALNREIRHENVVALKEAMLEDKSIYMVFEYAEHDFLQLIHHHSQLRKPIAPAVLKSLIHQLLNGLVYLHSVHVLHRDLKPANILITASGVVKIGDLGLARLVYQPLQPLVQGDKVVVTIWYRAPELLLGAKHYNNAIDCWAVGCVFAEMIGLKPIFKGEEAKIDPKKNLPFQREQLGKIFDVLGPPDERVWPDLKIMPEYQSLQAMNPGRWKVSSLHVWWNNHKQLKSEMGYNLLAKLFEYDPGARLTARQALDHAWFGEEPLPNHNVFFSTRDTYPQRRISDDAPSMLGTSTAHASRPNSGTVHAGKPPIVNPPRKRPRLE